MPYVPVASLGAKRGGNPQKTRFRIFLYMYKFQPVVRVYINTLVNVSIVTPIATPLRSHGHTPGGKTPEHPDFTEGGKAGKRKLSDREFSFKYNDVYFVVISQLRSSKDKTSE